MFFFTLLNSAFGGVSSSSSAASPAASISDAVGGFTLPKENGVDGDVNEKPVGAEEFDSLLAVLPNPINPEVLGLSSLFKPKLNPFVFGSDVAEVAAAAASVLAGSLLPKLKKLGLGVPSVLASVGEALTPKLKVLVDEPTLDVASDLVDEPIDELDDFGTVPNENFGGVAVVVVPPLVTVQLGFLPKAVDGEVVTAPIGVLGLPKEKPMVAAGAGDADAAIFVVVALLLLSSFCCNSFNNLS